MTTTFRQPIAITALLLSCVIAAAGQPVHFTWFGSKDPEVNAYKLYVWTNTPDSDCVASNAVEKILIAGAGTTNAEFAFIIPADYTFGLTTCVTNLVETNTAFGGYSTNFCESPFSNWAYWHVPPAPESLVNVQISTNLINWTNSQIFFRLKIYPPQ